MTDTTRPRPHVEHEVDSQPQCWAQAVAAVPEQSSLLPNSGERVAVIGCGTSLYVARAYAALREAAATARRTPSRPANTASGGATTASWRSLARGPRRRCSTRSTRSERMTTAQRSRRSLSTRRLRSARPRTSSPCRLPPSSPWCRRDFPPRCWRCCGPRSAKTCPTSSARRRLPLRPSCRSTPPGFARSRFSGRVGPGAIAEEAALKCREAAGFWTEAYPAMEYRHGPISVSGPGTAVWVFGDLPTGLADDVAATGAQLVSEDLDPMVDLIRAQRLAIEPRPARRPRPRPAPVAVVQRDPRRRAREVSDSIGWPSSPSTSVAPRSRPGFSGRPGWQCFDVCRVDASTARTRCSTTSPMSSPGSSTSAPRSTWRSSESASRCPGSSTSPGSDNSR